MVELEVLDQPATAAVAMEPVRARVLAALARPGSATTVAATLGLSRQQVNHHVRTLESHGLVRLVEERPRRGLTERVVQATAGGYVVSPAVLGAAAADPERADRLSARYLIALAARMVGEVGALQRHADDASKSLATLAIDADIRFASAADRTAFTRELTGAVAALAARFHDETAPGGRWHRLVVAAHPKPTEKEGAR